MDAFIRIQFQKKYRVQMLIPRNPVVYTSKSRINCDA